ncbi:MAG: MoaD/ThiS family protein [Candidatus Binatia bacterium]
MEGTTIAVRVKFMGDLRALLRQADLTITLPQGSTVGDLFVSLRERYGEPFACRVFSGPGTLHHYILAFLNGQNIKEVGGMDARLGEGQVEIVMLPMIEGG